MELKAYAYVTDPDFISLGFGMAYRQPLLSVCWLSQLDITPFIWILIFQLLYHGIGIGQNARNARNPWLTANQPSRQTRKEQPGYPYAVELCVILLDLSDGSSSSTLWLFGHFLYT
ncbi:hypothetical protein I7I48_04025 [Histoplasma ohiense]|nr:hypothetical protein I7I48_04025 [Histoplasma ohiense (nom. inval.)]